MVTAWNPEQPRTTVSYRAPSLPVDRMVSSVQIEQRRIRSVLAHLTDPSDNNRVISGGKAVEDATVYGRNYVIYHRHPFFARCCLNSLKLFMVFQIRQGESAAEILLFRSRDVNHELFGMIHKRMHTGIGGKVETDKWGSERETGK